MKREKNEEMTGLVFLHIEDQGLVDSWKYFFSVQNKRLSPVNVSKWESNHCLSLYW